TDVTDFNAIGGESWLSEPDRARLDAARGAPRIDYTAVRALKRTALRAAFARFFEAEWCRDTERARALRLFLSEPAWWSARRSADLYDGCRVDHLVGFYRTYGRPVDGSKAFFTPADQPSQVALGERILGLLRAAGAEIIAEDLGTVPDFVRESLARLAIPGFCVFRWERYWHTDGQPF